MGWPFELDICFLLTSQQVICQCFYRFCPYCFSKICISPQSRRGRWGDCFSLATERPAREKLQPLRGRALSKTSIIIAWYHYALIFSQVQIQGHFIDRHPCDAQPSSPRQCAHHLGLNTLYDTVLAAIDTFLDRSIFHSLGGEDL